jgi:hypothetical protein
VRRPWAAALIIGTGLLVLADFLVVNESLGAVASFVFDVAIVVAAGAALAAVGSLAQRRAADVWHRRGEPVGAILVLAGMAAMLLAGLRPGSQGAGDPAVRWLLVALLIPIGATLFGLLFISTLSAARRSVGSRSRGATVMVVVAAVVLVLLIPLGGDLGARMGEASAWALEAPIAAVFRGLLVGVAIVAAVFAARTMLGLGPRDD